MEQYVVFKSHEQLFSLPVSIVKRVVEEKNFITLPDVPAFVLGAYEFQEHLVPIIDLREKLFGLATEAGSETKIILCSWKGQSLGLLVESIAGISSLTETDYEEELAKADLKRGYIDKFLKLDKQVVIAINLEYLFDNRQEEILQNTFAELNSQEEKAVEEDEDKDNKKGTGSDGPESK
ncbi:chemotaxis protein CheW [Liquorilactobacillus oeni]|uniref:Chemotaxis protein CheW n=2 Tax=Liquorilactobacillus oeni TaxID=303241 RepID=A0A0R1MJG6_9LACO|nr:chemotaxis protein CheW [Liquorilactobacillus oeni]AJA34187.1 purine-binding chemotaxis protein CheW [Liquorilactobacillus oeni]KRL05493.1 chemotaxis protein CheW [Liquorilactobacillus oeni DSM 19972]